MKNPLFITRILIFVFLYTLIGINSSIAETDTSGWVSGVRYDKKTHQLHISGSTWNKAKQEPAKRFEITANGIAPASIEIREITDQQGDNKNSGFTLIANFDRPIKKGLAEIKVVAIFSDIDRLSLRMSDSSPIFLHRTGIYSRHWILLGLIILTVIAVSLPRVNQKIINIENWMQYKTKSIAIGIFFAFVLLVGAGVTGSSMRILWDGPFGKAAAELKGSDSRIFKLRPDRGDEWGVLVPNALAQVHHIPPFPITNTNIGLDGQNMGVIGMTGVPIKQWAAFARPATWGYFFLPLRQAQAWQWQLPFWGCLLAFWWLLSFWKPQQQGRNLAFAVLFCIAPYAAAWSNWPLYAVFFPALALAMAMKLTETKKLHEGIFLGIGIGYIATAWFLILYPPWIITVGTLIFLLYIGWALDRLKSLRFRKPQAAGVMLALTIVTVLLGSWWLDTREAIAALQNTVYPGQRTTLTGGDSSFLWLFRGYTNLEAVTFGTGPWTNQPEISSYLWLPLVTLWLCAWGIAKDAKNRWLITGLSLFIGFYICFVSIGIPLWVAEISQWGRVPTNRADVSLGLAFVILISLASREWFQSPASSSIRQAIPIATGLILLASLWLVLQHLTRMPIYVFPKNSSVYIAALLFWTLCCSWWLLRGETSKALTLILVVFLVSSLGFNPVSRAPREVSIAPQIKHLASDENHKPLRTLVIGGEGIGSLSLAAIGIPIVNGVLYYPHRTLWNQIDLPVEDWKTVNRYQHLGFFTGTPANGASYSVESPAVDRVSVTIDPATFDFSRTGAQRVTALEEQAVHLRKSSMLEEIGSHKGLVWFSIK